MKDLNSLVSEYFKLEKQIEAAFKFEGDWRAYPLSDCRDMYWKIDGRSFYYYEEPLTEDIMNEGAYYCADIVHDHIHRADGLTLVVGDTNCDFNIFSFILDNSKECKEEE